MQTKIIPIKKDWRNSLIRFIQWLMAVFFLFAVFSCGNKEKDVDVTNPTTDTTRSVLAYYVAPDLSKVTYAMIVRVISDSVRWQQLDSTTIKKKKGLDTIYYCPHFPSYEDTLTKLMYIDSAKGRRAMNGWWLTQKQYVRDGWNDSDSALRYLTKFVKPK